MTAGLIEKAHLSAIGLIEKTWITDIVINQQNAHTIVQGGRACWHVENKTLILNS